jgi:energy-coupling factor transporter ATP-binding protein EcfA2
MDAVTLGADALKDIDIDKLVAGFAIKTQHGAAALRTRLAEPTADRVELDKRQARLRDMRKLMRDSTVRERVEAATNVLRDTEEDVRTIAEAGQDKRYTEYYNQILWDPTSWLSQLNRAGWLVELIVLFRTIFLPAISVLTPLMFFLAPVWFYYAQHHHYPTATEYLGMLQQAFQAAIPSVMGRPRFRGRGGLAEAGEQMVHMIGGAGLFIASIWNQISAARSLHRVATDMRARAGAVRRMSAAVKDLRVVFGLPTDDILSWPIQDMGIFGIAWNTPAVVQTLLAQAGELDMLIAVARQRRMAFVRYGEELVLRDLYHPGVGVGGILNSVAMTAETRRHVLLTGPNRGGKSTFLKAIGAAVLMSQTLGVVFARRAVLPVFRSIVSALNPSDTMGKMSLFEAEIEFAKSVKAQLDVSAGQPMFLLMDEIFHGTNAHDGVEASQVFLDQLYDATDGVWSIVSTHYLNLPNRYGETKTQNLCMEATADPNDPDQLVYTYKLCQGINHLSSVREILRERGLLAANRGTVTEKTPALASKV